ncbi:Regulatory protein soxS [Raoultella terrigena]|uniref:Regulatory protein soxS n=1 Tax=Raoultella terrigena TaxID=577 RepID=A0A4U9CZH8_RAOTE|nr:Regulatory protein soxS [Raoultella terrigena]
MTVRSDHHTLSLYVADGYESYQKTAAGLEKRRRAGSFLPDAKGGGEYLDIRGDLSFVHLYCTDAHLRRVGEQVWDRSPASFSLQEQTFSRDDKITAVYRQFLLDYDWQQQANQLTLSSASTLLLTHLIQHYSNVQWRLPTVTGGLAPHVLRTLLAWIEENLDQPLTLADLAQETALSEYHFARMFRQSMKMAPHQYVMQRRMLRAQELICHSARSLTDIALACGFSSASHFSNRVKSATGLTPSQLRAAQR